MNVGIIGYGAIAREHALSLRRIGQAPENGRVNLVGVMGRLLEPTRAFAEEFGATLATTELDERLGPLLMVCHTQRYAAPLIEARRMIADGEVRPSAIVCRYLLDKRE